MKSISGCQPASQSRGEQHLNQQVLGDEEEEEDQQDDDNTGEDEHLQACPSQCHSAFSVSPFLAFFFTAASSIRAFTLFRLIDLHI